MCSSDLGPLGREGAQPPREFPVGRPARQRLVKRLEHASDLIRGFVDKFQSQMANAGLPPGFQMRARLLRFRSENRVAATHVSHHWMRAAFGILEFHAVLFARTAAIAIAGSRGQKPAEHAVLGVEDGQVLVGDGFDALPARAACEIGEGDDPKSVSHENTFSIDTDDTSVIDAMLVRLSEMVARRLRDHQLHARTIQIKLRYSDFSTFTRAKTLDHATQIDTELAAAVRALFHKNWTGKAIRLLGVYAQSLEAGEGQTSLLEEDKTQRWRSTLAAVDKIREKYGDTTVSLASGMNAPFRVRVHENPENLPGKEPKGTKP